jgi:hypothetical protein
MSPHNGFYDNSIPGVKELNKLAKKPAPNTSYFTMSFDATVEFPEGNLSAADLAAIPFTIRMAPFHLAVRLSAASLAALTYLPGFPGIVNLARLAVKVANSKLEKLGYFNRIPLPGTRVPRADMLPLMVPTSIAMGGYQMSAAKAIMVEECRCVAEGKYPGVTYHPIDGMVNTESMRGPNDEQIKRGATSYSPIVGCLCG